MKKITKFEVSTERCEFRFFGTVPALSTQDIIDLYNGLSWCAPELVGSFATLDEARKAYEEEKAHAMTRLSSGNGCKLIHADVVILAESVFEVDDDGEEEFAYGNWADVYAEPFTAEEADD